jgi:hypothetical protein
MKRFALYCVIKNDEINTKGKKIKRPSKFFSSPKSTKRKVAIIPEEIVK